MIKQVKKHVIAKPQYPHGEAENGFPYVVLWSLNTYTYKINIIKHTYIKMKLGTMVQATDPSIPEVDRSQWMEGQTGTWST